MKVLPPDPVAPLDRTAEHHPHRSSRRPVEQAGRDGGGGGGRKSTRSHAAAADGTQISPSGGVRPSSGGAGGKASPTSAARATRRRRVAEQHQHQPQHRDGKERGGGGGGGGSPPHPERSLGRHDRVAPADPHEAQPPPPPQQPRDAAERARPRTRSHRSGEGGKARASRRAVRRSGSSEMAGKGGEAPRANGDAPAAAATGGGRSFRDRMRKSAPRGLSVDAAAAEAEADARRKGAVVGPATPRTDATTPPPSADPAPASAGGCAHKTPAGTRGRGDLRSPGADRTPAAPAAASPPRDGGDRYANEEEAAAAAAAAEPAPIPDFITQTDKYGRAVTPRTPDAISAARKTHPSGPVPHIRVTSDGKPVDNQGHVVRPGHPPCRSREGDASVAGEEGDDESVGEGGGDGGKPDSMEVDACDALLESLRMMCCCLLPEDGQGGAAKAAEADTSQSAVVEDKAEQQATATVSGDTEASGNTTEANESKTNYSTRGDNAPMLVVEDTEDDSDRVRLLPKHHPDDLGKKCLVLDLDETLVHSSFRAVPGADFVIPVQIEDVVHFVYVMKRPGVDEFLIEMAKHYEVVVYTASLNKYADPLLDLLDPHRTIRTRLFRESCVYYEGNYVKDLSLLDRDLSQSIIVDNSPSSYMFHPENAIDCSSFIDDPGDRELDQIAAFLSGIRDVDDVRHVCNLWREWPDIPRVPGLVEDEASDQEEKR